MVKLVNILVSIFVLLYNFIVNATFAFLLVIKQNSCLVTSLPACVSATILMFPILLVTCLHIIFD